MPLTNSIFDGRSKSILIVDDDRIILELLAVMLEKYGFIVFKAENGLEAWSLFNSEHIDVVLTDIRMPELNGKELSHRIREQAPFTKSAVMTGGETDVAAELMQDGTADYYFLKPFDIKTVCNMLSTEAWAA
jgi:DNA-binding NtrC family response regulator